MENEVKIIARVQSLVNDINALDDEKERQTIIDQVEDALRGLNYRNGDTLEGFVYKTTDLTQFRDLDANRIINEESQALRELADSIIKHGNLSPIQINEKWEVIDGQRRLRANRKYGIGEPMLYFRRKGYNINSVSEMNRNLQKWTHKDWLHRFVTEKRADYIDYVTLAKKYEPYMKSRSLRCLLMWNRVESFPSSIWEGGEFKIDRMKLPQTIKFLDFLTKVYDIAPDVNLFARDRNFQKALHDIYVHTKKLDEGRLMYKIQNGFKRLNVKADYRTYKSILGTLYNSRLAGTVPHIVTQEKTEEPQLMIPMGEGGAPSEEKKDEHEKEKPKPKAKVKSKAKGREVTA